MISGKLPLTSYKSFKALSNNRFFYTFIVIVQFSNPKKKHSIFPLLIKIVKELI